MTDIGNNYSTESNSKKQVIEQALPVDCKPLTHQVAGHFFGKGRTKLGFLQTKDGYVLKPVQSPPRGDREHNFFKRIFTSDQSELNQDERDLKCLLPHYRGSVIHNEIIYIKMDDLAYGIKYPAVIDFKIGRQTYDPEASIEKIERQKLKYPPVERIGFQLLGMRVFNEIDKSFLHYDKIFGRALDEADLIHGLGLYYQFHQSPKIRAIQDTIKKFQSIQEWFEKQKTYHFYSSSVIVVYDADSPVDTDSTQTNPVRIKLADFAHVFPADNKLDENYLYGLTNLVEHLKMLLHPEYVFKDVREQP